METGYQLFVDGRLAGSFGPIQSSWNYVVVKPRLRPIPCCLRPAYVSYCHPRLAPSSWADFTPGGFYGSSYFGDSRLIAQRAETERLLQWNGFVNEYVYAVLSMLVGLVVLVLFSSAAKNVSIYGSRCFYWRTRSTWIKHQPGSLL